MYSCQVKNLTYHYPLSTTPALQKINFCSKKGEFIAIIGNNGAGKTTLCNALRRFIPDFYKGELTGSVEIFGKDSKYIPREELVHTMGYVSQNPFVQISGSRQTVYEEIAFGLENLGYSLNEIHRKVSKIIQVFQLTEFSRRNPLHLSGGQKQKVALASAIVMDPNILLLDEPTSQLDPESSKEIFSIVEALKKNGKTVFIAEHKMDLIAEYADKILLMEHGEVRMFDTPQHVFLTILKEGIPVNCPTHMDVMYKLIQKNRLFLSINDIPIKRQQAKELLRKGGITYEIANNIQSECSI